MKKNIVIFGDSYSTFAGYIPKGYAAYYSETPRPETDVTKVEQTWWHQMIEETDSRLIRNDSWSGSTIGYTGWNGVDGSSTDSFIYRLRTLAADGFFTENKIDRVFVFGGTNDSWSDAPLGEMKESGWQEKDLYTVLPAVSCFFHLLRQTLPEAEIYCLINNELKPEIVCCMERACETYRLIPVTFDCIDKRSGHPTVQGMKDIKNRVVSVICEKSDV